MPRDFTDEERRIIGRFAVIRYTYNRHKTGVVSQHRLLAATEVHKYLSAPGPKNPEFLKKLISYCEYVLTTYPSRRVGLYVVWEDRLREAQKAFEAINEKTSKPFVVQKV